MTEAHSAVLRVKEEMARLGMKGEIKHLSDTARSAQEAADALGIKVGQVASSIVFGLPDGSPLLVITSGAHRVDTKLVAEKLGVPKLSRVDADYVREKSGYAIGGVSPIAWSGSKPTILIDSALAEFDEVWAAAGHTHAVFPSSFEELQRVTGATPMEVGE